MDKKFKVISVESKSGISHNGIPYCYESLIINFNGKTARIIKPRDMEVKANDYVELGIGTRKGYGCADVTAIVTNIIKGE